VPALRADHDGDEVAGETFGLLDETEELLSEKVHKYAVRKA
jgi:hypothetical protein